MRMMAELLRQGRYADEVMAILDKECVVAGTARGDQTQNSATWEA